MHFHAHCGLYLPGYTLKEYYIEFIKGKPPPQKKHFGNRNCFFNCKLRTLDIKIVYLEIAEYVTENRRMTALGEFHTGLITDSSVSYLGPQGKHSPGTNVSIKS